MINTDSPSGPHSAEKKPAVSVCVLGSGSKGNAIYVSDGSSAILVDAGFSGIEIQRRMAASGLDPSDLSAIVVTHEHSDHIHGVGVLSRRFRLPVYLSPATEKAAAAQFGKLYRTRHFQCGKTFAIDEIRLHPFPISHDADDPAGFTVACNGVKLGIATDLGIATHVVKTHLQQCALLILEANHDPGMLENGPYPWPLKQRVSGRTGHLSNAASGALLGELQHDRLRHVILAHLSEVNNTPNHAFAAVARALTRCRPQLDVAAQHQCGPVIHLT